MVLDVLEVESCTGAQMTGHFIEDAALGLGLRWGGRWPSLLDGGDTSSFVVLRDEDTSGFSWLTLHGIWRRTHSLEGSNQAVDGRDGSLEHQKLGAEDVNWRRVREEADRQLSSSRRYI